MKHLRLFSILSLACLVLAACQSKHASAVKPRPDAPQNWFLPTEPGRVMRRVAMLPIYHARLPGEILKDVDVALTAELAKKSLFEVVPISRPEMEALINVREVASVERIPGDLFRKLRDQYGVEGVMLTDLTHYSPYRPVSIGVRSKLVDIETGRIHWASDVVVDSGNGDVAAAARRYQKTLCRDNFPIEGDGGTVLLSPRQFVQFAAYTNYASLNR
jgi:hypothetical protein